MPDPSCEYNPFTNLKNKKIYVDDQEDNCLLLSNEMKSFLEKGEDPKTIKLLPVSLINPNISKIKEKIKTETLLGLIERTKREGESYVKTLKVLLSKKEYEQTIRKLRCLSYNLKQLEIHNYKRMLVELENTKIIKTEKS